MRLILIGLAAGFFSALFGIGGGTVIVPLLLVVTPWGIRSATATSLAAIGITAIAGVAAYVVHHDVQTDYALLLGVPAAAGAAAGAALQQRIHGRALSLGFSVLLVGIAVDLLVK